MGMELMASSSSFGCRHSSFLIFIIIISVFGCAAHAQLSTVFYARSCPNVVSLVRSGMANAMKTEPRMAASILRLFFHDCFTNGCDGSILLDDDLPRFISEKDHAPNRKSARGYEVIDDLKFRVEKACRATVSCADILAIAAREAVSLSGGPTWPLPLGRQDARRPSSTSDLPAPFQSLSDLIRSFAAKNLTARDMTALSGAHTIGMAQCFHFRDRLVNDGNIDPSFAATQGKSCPSSGAGGENLAALDPGTPSRFDNSFFKNLMAKRGLLHSDQELFNGGPTDAYVKTYSKYGSVFAKDFADAMVKVGNLNPLAGNEGGEVRLSCRKINS